jgi:hypothetical protein
MPTNSPKDSAAAIVRDLAATPNGAPTHYYEIPRRDPGGQVISHDEAVQCLLCYKGAKGRRLRHEKSCPWVRARALMAASKKRRGK